VDVGSKADNGDNIKSDSEKDDDDDDGDAHCAIIDNRHHIYNRRLLVFAAEGTIISQQQLRQ
jgi:hypothetical protein